MCFGTSLAEYRGEGESRWRYIRGLPLNVSTEPDGWLPFGCLSVTSMAPKDETLLTRLPDAIQAQFTQTLVESVRAYLKEALLASEGGVDSGVT